MKAILHVPAHLRAQSSVLSPDVRQSNVRSKEDVLAFQFQPLIDRMVDKYGWDPKDAGEVFEDTKKFLYLCATADGHPLAPPEKIDEVWHNFILFTEDYQVFCKKYLGQFIHHRPNRKGDQPSKKDLAFLTLGRAVEVFGHLSQNWVFRRKDGSILTAEGCISCVPGSCSSCAPTQSCES